MDLEDMLEFINDIVKDCGQVVLSEECERYHLLMWDEKKNETLVFCYNKRGADTIKPLRKLDPNWIWVIYDDVFEDFG